MSNLLNVLFGLLTVFILSGCAAGLSVDRISDTRLDPKEKELVLLNNSRFDQQIKKELVKAGFRLKDMPTVKVLQKKVDENTVEQFNLAEAKYGLRQVPGMIIDRCIAGKALQFDEYTFEVVDLENNQTVMFVNKGGWTGPCFPSSGTLFQDLSQELANNWH